MSGSSTAIDFRVIDEILAKYEYKKSYLIAKKLRITFYKIITYIPRAFSGTLKRKAKNQ